MKPVRNAVKMPVRNAVKTGIGLLPSNTAL
jgi:hypothetical protein